ncbi:hypothetical protein R3L02_42050 [Streptomyces scabiei]|uniref:hypothetical protein n=1 Tax=Streptomyces scabiei TaxID=1930 RepID=UPI00298F23FD|nr:hypothetical protein [Streptomyces scabiei]MDW8478334.1 hypothetical protein [Streptomyces scabiei]
MPAPDDTLEISPVHPVVSGLAPGDSLRWTWPVTRATEELVRGTVTEAFTHWGLRPAVADLLGDLAAEFAGAFPRSPYLTVAAGWTDHQAMVSVRTAESLAGADAPMNLRQRLTCWGVRGFVGDTDAYAVVRFARRIPRIEEQASRP